MWDYIVHQLQTNQFFSAGLVVSAMGGLVFYLKSLPQQVFIKLKSRVWFTATLYQTDELYVDFERWFFTRYKEKYRNVEAASIDSESNSPSGQLAYSGNGPENTRGDRMVSFKQIEGIFFIKYKGRYILIKKGRDKLEHTSDLRSMYMNQYHLSCVNGSAIIKELLQECIEANSKKDRKELRVITHDTYGNWVTAGRISAKPMDSVILPEALKLKITSDLDVFMSSRDWYDNASIFYKRGHLYHGLPGNGKTSLALAISSYLNRDVCCMDLNSIGENDKLRQLFGQIGNNTVLLIEDIDGFFKLREPVKKESKISFSTFLNCLDGAFYKEGLITIITTNKLEDVDPALKRTGRMDLVLEIPKPGIHEVSSYLNVFYRANGAIKLTSYVGDYSMSDIQELCIQYKDDSYQCVNKLQGQEHLNIAI